MRDISLFFVCISGFVLVSGCGSGEVRRGGNGEMLIIAHRGASEAAPENTVSAAVLAWKNGADAVEVDIHLSRDKHLMVIHDDSTKNTAGVDLKIKETDSAALRRLDVGSHKSKRWSGEKIPYLDEIIDTVPPGGKLFVEVKSDAETLPYLKRIIERSGKRKQIVVIGFELEDMAEMKRMMPDIPVYWLKGADKDKESKKYIPFTSELIGRAREKGLDGLNVFHEGMTAEFAADVLKSGLGLYVWTVDDADRAIEMSEMSVQGVTTNVPCVMKSALRQ
ncbi:MAG: hypothetical protein JW720_02790 [Sedimentisphaerales bacterium]|nr:hypothetical protein [Sedimentisphaerales bacterium]